MFEAKYKALSIKQPWAWLICAGWKDVENRNWPTSFSGRIHVHTGMGFDAEGYNALLYYSEPLGYARQYLVNVQSSGLLVRGAIIGEVDITGCVDKSGSPWFSGPYGFTLSNMVLYDKPIPCKGKLGFFSPELTEVSVFGLG